MPTFSNCLVTESRAMNHIVVNSIHKIAAATFSCRSLMVAPARAAPLGVTPFFTGVMLCSRALHVRSAHHRSDQNIAELPGILAVQFFGEQHTAVMERIPVGIHSDDWSQ